MTRRTDSDTLGKLRAMLAAAELPPPAPPTSKKAKAPRKTLAPTTIDLRAPTNTKPHVRIPYNGPQPKTPAAAAKLRRVAMAQCECRLCALALNPPKTFEEARLCGMSQPSLNAINALQELRAGVLLCPLPLDVANTITPEDWS